MSAEKNDKPLEQVPQIRFTWPGRRILKTGIAIALALIYGQIFHPQLTAYFAVSSSIVCMTKDIRNTFHVGLIRVIGTLVGGGVAVLWFIFLADLAVFQRPWVPEVALVAVNVLLIWLLVIFGLQDAASLAALTFTAVVMFADPGSSGVASATLRAVDAAVGAVIAMGVNWLPFLRPTEEESALLFEQMRNAAVREAHRITGRSRKKRGGEEERE